MDIWDYDVRSQPDTPANFPNLAALCRHFEGVLSRERIDERIEAEKTVFIIRRESSLEDTMRQFLRRMEAVLRSEVEGRPLSLPSESLIHERPPAQE